ncbi:KH domain-containing protein [Candidatus Peregrinibacteria bacterium]|nr:KH domain-containing protein [Candidatus Peregrinibacteria bacterium]
METLQRTILVKETLSELLRSLNIPVRKIIVEESEDGVVRANVETDSAPLLIGSHGQTLEALQIILKHLLWKNKFDEMGRVVIDVNDYKLKREEKILEVAEAKAESVRATNIPQYMPPLSPYLRRLVHMHLAQERFADIETESVGEEGMRKIQIKKRGTSSLSLEGAGV